MRGEKAARQRGHFLLFYTILFILSATLAFRYFPAAGKRMVWKGDGLSQHYVALCYYARWGRAVLRSLLAGRPAFPTLNLHMGLGADLFTTLQYYVIGDPFSLPAVFVPQKYMLVFHDAMILLRMYLAGICFDRYCRAMGHGSLVGNGTGALVYVFGTFALFGMRHPYFLNAMIWFPLLLLGAEDLFHGKRGRRFTLAVFFSCISNFYFFYMLVVLTVVYVVWRTMRIYLFPACRARRAARGQREGAGVPAQVGRLAALFLGRAALGAAMGACFLLPILLRFVQDPRASEGTAQGLFYALSYYAKLPEAFVGFGTDQTLAYWTCMGFGALGLISVCLLFLNADSGDSAGRRPDPADGESGLCPADSGTEQTENESCAGLADGESGLSPADGAGQAGEGSRGGAARRGAGVPHTNLKIAFLFMALLVLLPAGGTVLNGFSYPANRWTWAFALLMGYITAVMLPHLGEISLKKTAVLLGVTALCAGGCLWLGAARSTLLELALAGAVIVAVRALTFFSTGRAGLEGAKEAVPAGRRRFPARAAAGLVLAGGAVLTAALHAYVAFVPGRENSSLAEYHTDRYIAGMVASDAAGMRALLGNASFYRYSGRDLANNFSLLHDVSNTQYYWSLSDGGITRFFAETGQGNGMIHLYDNLDNRTMVDEIAGVQYYKRSDGSLLPFGYERIEGAHYDNRALFTEDEGDPIPVFSFAIYENRYALPLGFTSGAYVTRETYDALPIPERQEALMQGILLEEPDLGEVTAKGRAGSLQEADLSFSAERIPFTARAEDGIRVREGADGAVEIIVEDTGKALYLDVADPADLSDREISVLFAGMDYGSPAEAEEKDKASSQRDAVRKEENAASAARAGEKSCEASYENTEPVEITVTAKRDGDTVSEKKIAYTLPENPWKTGRSDFLSCCGYAQTPPDLLRLKFSRPGTYTFRSLELVGQPMAAYPEQAEALRAYTLEDLDLHALQGSGATSRITGRIAVPDTRILCLQIPHLRGLRGFVDGQEQPLLQADTMFSALVLEPGAHEIELRYRTPGLAAGAWFSLAALVVFLAEVAADAFRKKRENR